MSRKKKKEFKELSIGAEASESAEYMRGRWHHYLRWLMFTFLLFFAFILALNSYSMHVLKQQAFMAQEFVGYLIIMIMMIPVLPSIVLEVDYVRIEDDEVVFQNLFLRRSERWENIVRFDDPVFLKFSIVRSRGFIYLLNRRDIPSYDELAETIKRKAVNLKK